MLSQWATEQDVNWSFFENIRGHKCGVTALSGQTIGFNETVKLENDEDAQGKEGLDQSNDTLENINEQCTGHNTNVTVISDISLKLEEHTDEHCGQSQAGVHWHCRSVLEERSFILGKIQIADKLCVLNECVLRHDCASTCIVHVHVTT